MEILKQIAPQDRQGLREVRMRTMGSFLLGWILVGCAPETLTDRWPPRLLAAEVAADGKEIALSFDEPLAEASAAIDDGKPSPVKTEGAQTKVTLKPDLTPGSGHVWQAEVSDPANNVTTVAGKFYAPNPRPAGLRLNEVRIAGSGAHTDLVELRVEAEGSLGGWTVEVWSTPKSRQRLVLPDVEVARGELVVIRYRDPKDPVDTAAGTKEFWQPSAKGLSPTKGLVLLRQAPGGPGTDGLLYSKKPGEAAELAEASGWSDRKEEDPSPCTATRTWSRTEEGTWIVTATGGATPGAPNKLTPWTGPSSHAADPTSNG